jgi:predicted dehydrogenase
MSNGKLKIGFVGVGAMGQCAHLRNYALLPDCEVVAIAELREDVRQRVAERYSVPRTYGDHAAMLASEKLDGIVASQHFGRHGVVLPDLIASGIPLFTEKPLASAPEVGARLAAAVKARGSLHMVGYHKRSDPATMHAKAEIDRLKASGELGRLTYVRILMPAGDWVQGGFDGLISGEGAQPPLEWDPPPADMDEKARGTYEAFVNYYIHQVNLMRHLLGEAYEVTYADPSEILLAGRSASGAPCTIEMTPYRTTVDWQEQALVCFEKGFVKLDLPAPLALNRPGRVEILHDPGDGARPRTIVPQLPWIGAMRQQAANFLRAIRGEAKPPCDAVEALEDLRVARQYIRLLTGK